MAITDLLWACPECGADALRGTGDGAACDRCDAHYIRGLGAAIRRERPGRAPLTLSAAEWLDRLPPVERLFEADGALVREARVRLATAVGEEAVYGRGRYLNRIERFGEAVPGTVRLYEDHLEFESDPESAGPDAEGESWSLDELTALQPSSRTLQLKARGRPLASFEFPDASVRLWEELLTAALRRRYRALGRGEIVEFQPRIVTE